MKRKSLLITILAVSLGAALVACGSSQKADEASQETVVEENTESEAEETTETGTDEATESEEVSIPEICGASETTFLEERTGAEGWNSLDEIVEQLQPGEAYAYITVAGHDEEVLAVTDATYEWDQDNSAVAIDMDIYGKCGYIEDQGYIHLGSIHTGGTGNPIRLSEDGIISANNNRSFREAQINDQDLLVYSTDISIEYDTDGNATVTGYKSADGSLDNFTEDIGASTEEEFYALFDGVEDIPLVNFTVVE